MRTIDITNRKRPVLDHVNGQEQPSGPIDIMALAEIRTVCPGERCKRVTSIETKLVRITSDGRWHGTRVHYEDGSPVIVTYSVLVTVPDDGAATALVLAHHAVDGLVRFCCRGGRGIQAPEAVA